MLGFLYLALIVGWMLIVIILKCKKVIAPYLVYTSELQPTERRPSVHVIQLDNDETQCQSGRQSILSDDIESYSVEVLTNPGYERDEDIMFNAPPPSYDEVMRQPGVYPKVQDLKNAQI